MIFLIGTTHPYQINAPGHDKKCGAPQFKQYIRHIISKHSVDYLFEELNADRDLTNISGIGRHESWLEVIARETTISHKFIDPGCKERLYIGIQQGEECTPEGIEKRECYWLDRVRECGFSTALCVIGAEHINTFSARLSQEYICTIENEWYDPMNILQKPAT